MRYGERGERTDTGSASEVIGVTHVAMAAEGADAVDALAVLTQVRHHLTLVDVCKNTVDMVKKNPNMHFYI